jgi:hypothetical protein
MSKGAEAAEVGSNPSAKEAWAGGGVATGGKMGEVEAAPRAPAMERQMSRSGSGEKGNKVRARAPSPLNQINRGNNEGIPAQRIEPL